MARSSGSTRRRSTSLGVAPGIPTATSIMGTRIWGSSSRGVLMTAPIPTTSENADEEGRQLRVEESLGDPSRESGLHRAASELEEAPRAHGRRSGQARRSGPRREPAQYLHPIPVPTVRPRRIQRRATPSAVTTRTPVSWPRRTTASAGNGHGPGRPGGHQGRDAHAGGPIRRKGHPDLDRPGHGVGPGRDHPDRGFHDPATEGADPDGGPDLQALRTLRRAPPAALPGARPPPPPGEACPEPPRRPHRRTGSPPRRRRERGWRHSFPPSPPPGEWRWPWPAGTRPGSAGGGPGPSAPGEPRPEQGGHPCGRPVSPPRPGPPWPP